MKKNNLTRGAFAVLLLASAAAGADQKYPAADFQPEVLYQDSDYIAKNSPSSGKSKAASSATASHDVDSKYPAANFQPEVVYHDPNYKPSESAKTKVSTKVDVGSNSEAGQSISATTASAEEKSSLSSYLLGLVAFAVAGFYFFKKRSTTTVQKQAPAAPAKPSYALTTGVAKYLNKVSGTGVSRYLEKNVKSAATATGVAKYMAKQAASPKTTAAKAATGVEKYMRDRG
ncbi:MAG: hypothetical protein PHO08_17455 [Methylococcales bacterium]|nr:hypothetical protein [Methylococcales bacterium]MDD5631792.1 hypothetical protein [Methylococcales bacterium]